MKTVAVTANNRALRKLLTQAGGEPLVLTEGGQPVAALMPLEASDAEAAAVGANPKFLRMVRKSLRQIRQGKKLSLAEMRKRVA